LSAIAESDREIHERREMKHAIVFTRNRMPARFSCLLWFLCCLASAVAVNSPTSFAANRAPARELLAAPRPLIVAHRGNSSVAPENTIPAFRSALEIKADLVELDYFHSADGVPVVLHDEILDRTTNAEQVLGCAKLVVGDLPLAELRKLDVGCWFDDAFTGTKIATLAESLDVIQAGSITLIERKGGDAQTLVRLLEEKKLIDDVIVQSFDWAFIAECRRLSPRLVLGTISSKPANDDQIKAAAATGADIIVWNHEKIGRNQIRLIHDLGKQAFAYTIDDPQRAAHLVAAGLDGIITNRPAEMMKLRSAQRAAPIAE
jgi:glycerophosphoryl diester phosphodiesterase